MALSKELEDLSIETHQKAKFLSKVKYAVLDKQNFEEIIDKILKLVSDLEDLFPGKQMDLQSLANDDEKKLGSEMWQKIEKQLQAWEAEHSRMRAASGQAPRSTRTVSQTNDFGQNSEGSQTG